MPCLPPLDDHIEEYGRNEQRGSAVEARGHDFFLSEHQQRQEDGVHRLQVDRHGDRERAQNLHDFHGDGEGEGSGEQSQHCLLYTSPSPRDQRGSRMPSSA